MEEITTLTTIDAPLDLLDWIRCVNMNEVGEQCDKYVRVTPAQHRLCQAHSPSRIVDTISAKVRYIDLVNKSRTLCTGMSFDALQVHIAHLEDTLEVVKAQWFTARACSSEKMGDMDETTRQARRAMQVQLVSPLKETGLGNKAKAASTETATEKTRILKTLTQEHKKPASEAMAIYNLMVKNKLTMAQALIIWED